MDDLEDLDAKYPFPPIPLQTRKLVEQAQVIAMETTTEVEFLHTILCQCGLPRSKVDGNSFERTAGSASLLLEAGTVNDGFGNWKTTILPYGAKPRLAMLHLCSEAVRTKSPHIDVGNSIRGFLQKMGIDYDASPRVLRDFKRQMIALSACRMTLAYWDNGRVKQTKADPIRTFEAWLPLDPNQSSFWADEIVLGQEFFEELCEHAVPLDPRAIRALKGSALALDIYTWLANRLLRVKKGGQMVSWKNLRIQFGQEYKTSKDFKREFRKALLKVRAVYPTARIKDDVIGGLMLYNSPPPIEETKTYHWIGSAGREESMGG